MGVQSTVVFADLFGSTGVFEALGNAKATEAVLRATTWVAKRCADHGGRVIKFLGDGVLVLYQDSATAVAAVMDLQQAYQDELSQMPFQAYMPLRVGVATGAVEIVDDDCYGDAVNIASRLSELTGPHQIWANSAAIENGFSVPDVRFRSLGPIRVRGRSELCNVYQVEWKDNDSGEFLTVVAGLDLNPSMEPKDSLGVQIEMSYLDQRKTFKAFDLPIHIGRTKQAQFTVNDPRVSRTHARIDWRNGSVILVDVSSYGCWVRFSGGGPDLLLRRDECALHGQGEIAMGAPFSDSHVPVVKFSVS
jgi:class 3 adenylate cyclase